MIKIAICDDDNYHLKNTANMILDIAKKNNIVVDIKTFDSSKSLMNLLYDNFDLFDIFFLDIVMDYINGIDLGKFIRKNNNLCEIILTTTSKEYMLDGYDINASNYLLKPLSEDKLERQFLKSAYIINKNSDNSIVIKSGANFKKIPLSNIIFFESKLRKVLITTLTESNINFYEKLEFINEKVSSKNFVRCHKSYIVNLHHIKEIEGNSVITTNDMVIPISRSYLKSTKESFMNYFMQNI